MSNAREVKADTSLADDLLSAGLGTAGAAAAAAASVAGAAVDSAAETADALANVAAFRSAPLSAVYSAVQSGDRVARATVDGATRFMGAATQGATQLARAGARTAANVTDVDSVFNGRLPGVGRELLRNAADLTTEFLPVGGRPPRLTMRALSALADGVSAAAGEFGDASSSEPPPFDPARFVRDNVLIVVPRDLAKRKATMRGIVMNALTNQDRDFVRFIESIGLSSSTLADIKSKMSASNEDDDGSRRDTVAYVESEERKEDGDEESDEEDGGRSRPLDLPNGELD